MTEDSRCPACNKVYDDEEELKGHMKQDHSELSETYLAREFLIEVPHSCAMCGEELDPSEPMTDHMQNAHAISATQGEPQYGEEENPLAEYPEAEDTLINNAFGDPNLEMQKAPDDVEGEEDFDMEDDELDLDEEINAELEQELGEDKDYENAYDLENNYKSEDIQSNECDQCNLSFDNKQELSTHKNDTHADALEFFLENDKRFFEGGVKTPAVETRAIENEIEPEEVIDAEHDMLDAGVDEEEAHDILKDLGDPEKESDKEEGEEQDHTGKHTEIFNAIKRDNPDYSDDRAWSIANSQIYKHGLESNIYSSVHSIIMGNEDFKEDEHPREEGGKFTSKDGGVSDDSDEKPSNKFSNMSEKDIIKSIKGGSKDFHDWYRDAKPENEELYAEIERRNKEVPRPKRPEGAGGTIFRDDPDAVSKMEVKVKYLEGVADYWKQITKFPTRDYHTRPTQLGDAKFYEMSNNSANLRDARKKLEGIKAQQARGTTLTRKPTFKDNKKRFYYSEEPKGESYSNEIRKILGLEHYDEEGTFWFTTNNGKKVGIQQGQNLEDALSNAGIPSDDYDDSDVSASDLASAEQPDGDIQEPSREEPEERPPVTEEPREEVPTEEEPIEGDLEDEDYFKTARSDILEQQLEQGYDEETNQKIRDELERRKSEPEKYDLINGEEPEEGIGMSWQEQGIDDDVKDKLIEKTGAEDLEVTDVSDSDSRGSSYGKMLTLSNGEEWQVYNSMEEAEQAVKEGIQNDIDSGDLGAYGGFNESFASTYMDMGEVDQRMWVSDEEDRRRQDLEYENDQLEDDNPEKKTEEEITQTIDEEMSGIREQLSSDALGYIRDNFGEEQVTEMVKNGTLKIDVERMGDDAIASDGLGHFLSSYDNNYEETSSGQILARHN